LREVVSLIYECEDKEIQVEVGLVKERNDAS
jgi:hypothetical protein